LESRETIRKRWKIPGDTYKEEEANKRKKKKGKHYWRNSKGNCDEGTF